MKYTIKNDFIYEEKINKSLFIANLGHVDTTISAKNFIHEVNKLHPQATHHCPAYIIGDKGEICFASDNQEPAGTAGKPILNMLLRHELTNVIIVVTRYYGGVKLGVRGLIEAYGSVAEKVILLAEKEPIVKSLTFRIEMPYNFYDTFTHHFTDPNISFLDIDFKENVQLTMIVKETYQKDIHDEINKMKEQKKIKIVDS